MKTRAGGRGDERLRGKMRRIMNRGKGEEREEEKEEKR